MDDWLEQPLYDSDAEQAALSCVLAGARLDGLRADHFHIDAHRLIFEALRDLSTKVNTPTQYELAAALKGREAMVPDVEQAVADVAGALIPASNLPYWVSRLEDFRSRRALWRAVQEARLLGGADAVRKLEDGLLAAQPAAERQRLLSAPLLAKGFSERLAERRKNPVPVDGIDLGFPTLAKITHGLHRGDLMMVAAKTGHGKSALALNIAAHTAVTLGVGTVLLNTEMSVEALTDRLLSIITGVPREAIQTGCVSETEAQLLEASAQALGQSDLVLSDALPGLDLPKVAAITRRHSRDGAQVLILDYIGRLDLGFGSSFQEYQLLGEAAKRLKRMAQELGIGVLVLAQLNEEGALAASKRMKNECDVFAKLSPVDETKDQPALMRLHLTPKDVNYWLELDKVRDGASGDAIPLWFEKPCLKFREASRRR